MRPNSAYALAGIAATGLTAALGQIILIRELLTLFSGFEAAAGAILTGWLAWTGLGSALASYLLKERPLGPMIPGLALMSLALTLPGTLLVIRAARMIWGTPWGEFPNLSTMLFISLIAPSLFCFLAGTLFSLTWSLYSGTKPVLVYAVEALASALAGLLFYFLLLPYFGNLEIAFLGACVPLAVSAALIRRSPGLWLIKIFWLAAAIAVTCPWPYMQDIETATRHWQWGPNLIAATDSAYQNLALLRHDKQWTLFADGNWFFSAPDDQSAEWATHPALASHQAPRRVLLIGGDPYGVIREILKHPTVEAVVYLEPDPTVLHFTQSLLPHSITEIVTNHRVKTMHLDAARFVKAQSEANEHYDVILLNLPEPVNAQLNRFYSLDFYQMISKLLNAEGLAALSFPAAQEALGNLQVRSLKQIYATLRAVFPHLEIMPGDKVQFFVSNSPINRLDAGRLSSKLAARGIDPTYVRQFALADVLSPFRRDYLESLLHSPPELNPNTAFQPACYLNALHLWSLHGAEAFGRILNFMESLNVRWLWAAAAFSGLLVLLAPKQKYPAWIVSANVAFVGGSHIAAQLVLLLGYQILAGNLYSRLAVLIAASMTGLALGSALATRPGTHNPAIRLFLVQMAFCLGLGATAAVISGIGSLQLNPDVLLAMFGFLALCLGVIGGLHFALAVAVRTKAVQNSAQHLTSPQTFHGGGLYGWDLTGAALGGMLTPLFLAPLWGLLTPLILAMILCLMGSIGLFRTLGRI